MQLRRVIEILGGSVLCGDQYLDNEVVTACGSDLMSDVLNVGTSETTLLLTGLTATQTIFIADAANIKAICFVRGKQPPEQLATLARERNMVILCTDLPMFEACGKLHGSGLKGCGEHER